MKFELLYEDVLKAEKPAGHFIYAGTQFPYWGNVTGRNYTIDYNVGKFNRYSKFGSMSDDVAESLKDIIRSRTNIIDGRCAYACYLMMQYGVRIGNEGSAEGYVSGLEKNIGEIVHTYGVTTLLNDHVLFDNDIMFLNFLGKEQVEQSITIGNSILVSYGRIYYDDSEPHKKWLSIDYDTLFGFIKKNIGGQFVPKDLRTFCANVSAWIYMQKYLNNKKTETKTDAKKELTAVVEMVANRLGNTPSVSRSNYLDKRMLDWFVSQRYVGDE